MVPAQVGVVQMIMVLRRGGTANDYGQMITVLHRGGYAQMITILHRGGGGLSEPPKVIT